MTIEPANGWAHNDITADYKNGRPVWREVNESFYHEMLNCMPPLCYSGGRFMIGEPYSDTANDVIYCALAHVGQRYFGRLLPRKQFFVETDKLKTFIQSHEFKYTDR